MDFIRFAQYGILGIAFTNLSSLSFKKKNHESSIYDPINIFDMHYDLIICHI